MKTLSLLFLTVNILLNIWHSESSCSVNQVNYGYGCVCHRGFGLVDGLCTKCDEKSYKYYRGNDRCTPCPDHSTCNDDRTGFTCNAGFERQGSHCYKCSTGFFKPTNGNYECTWCPDHSSSTEYGSTVCICDAGFTLDGTDCIECDKGFFKAEIGNSACKKCSTFFKTRSKGSTNEESCNVKKKGLIALTIIAVIIAICTIVVVIALIIKSRRNLILGI